MSWEGGREEGERHTNVGIPMQPHGIRLPHQNPPKRPTIRSMIIVNQKVRHQHHGLNTRNARHAHITPHPQRLVRRARIKLGSLLALPRAEFTLHKLRAQRQHHKDQRNKRRIALVFLLQAQSPKVLVVREKRLAVDHGIHGVDAFKVSVENEVDLHFGWEDVDDFGQAAVAGPVVGKRVFGADAEDVGGAGGGKGHVGEEAG